MVGDFIIYTVSSAVALGILMWVLARYAQLAVAMLDRIGLPKRRNRHSAEYIAYMQSDEWRSTRRIALTRAGNRCESCGESHGLEVHHLTYKRLGHELPNDLRVLCEDCHDAADRTRAAKARRAYA